MIDWSDESIHPRKRHSLHVLTGPRRHDGCRLLSVYRTRRLVAFLIIYAGIDKVVERLREPLSSLTHEDLLAYRLFVAYPGPVARWIMRGRRAARTEAEWRPFAGPLSAVSQWQAFIVLNTLFSWLVSAGYLAANPRSLSRQRTHHAKPRVIRFLDDELWQAVKTPVDAMPRESMREQRLCTIMLVDLSAVADVATLATAVGRNGGLLENRIRPTVTDGRVVKVSTAGN